MAHIPTAVRVLTLAASDTTLHLRSSMSTNTVMGTRTYDRRTVCRMLREVWGPSGPRRNPVDPEFRLLLFKLLFLEAPSSIIILT